MRVFVTGASGFVGSHLVDALLARGDEVSVLRRTASADTRHGLAVRVGNVLDRDVVRQAIADSKPEEVYHLAAQSLPRESWVQPALTFQTNVEGTVNVLDAIRDSTAGARVVVACSSAEYAANSSGQPISEDDALDPASPYGASKVACDHIARLYAQRFGMDIMRARPFFMIGSRKTGDVSSDWARGIVAIERHEQSELPVGNLDAVRDFLDVRDGVDAVMLLAARGERGEAYNIASGNGWSLADLLQLFVKAARTAVMIRQDAALLRPLDEAIKIGNNSRLRSLGWSQRHTIPTAVTELLDYWRARAHERVEGDACRS